MGQAQGLIRGAGPSAPAGWGILRDEGPYQLRGA